MLPLGPGPWANLLSPYTHMQAQLGCQCLCRLQSEPHASDIVRPAIPGVSLPGPQQRESIDWLQPLTAAAAAARLLLHVMHLAGYPNPLHGQPSSCGTQGCGCKRPRISQRVNREQAHPHKHAACARCTLQTHPRCASNCAKEGARHRTSLWAIGAAKPTAFSSKRVYSLTVTIRAGTSICLVLRGVNSTCQHRTPVWLCQHKNPTHPEPWTPHTCRSQTDRSQHHTRADLQDLKRPASTAWGPSTWTLTVS